MTREDEALLLALSRISKNSGGFALGVLENSISRDDQIAFGHRLVDLVEAIRDRALRTAGLVIEYDWQRQTTVVDTPTFPATDGVG